MVNFQRGDYRIEASLHAFDGLSLHLRFEPPFLLDGIDIWDKIRPVRQAPMIYKTIFPDMELDVPADAEQYRALLKDRFPAEASHIDELFDLMTGVLTIPAVWVQGNTTTEFLTQFTTNQELLDVLLQLVYYLGFHPDEVPAFLFLGMWYGYHVHGAYYFIGGSQSVSDALAEVVLENNGSIRLNSLATKIVVDGGRVKQVRARDGVCYNTRYVVSNANAPSTFLQLVGEEYLDPAFVEEVQELEVGSSAIEVYLGVDQDYSPWFGDTHEIWLNPAHDTADHHYAASTFPTCDPENISMAIANYTMLDPTSAPPGKNVIGLVSELDYKCNDYWAWENREDYKWYRDRIADVMIRRAEAILPGLSDHIEVYEFCSPQTIKQFTLNPGGSLFGYEPNLEQFDADVRRMVTPIENLYLAGAWTGMGGGQSLVVGSGIDAAGLIIQKEKPSAWGAFSTVASHGRKTTGSSLVLNGLAVLLTLLVPGGILRFRRRRRRAGSPGPEFPEEKAYGPGGP
jgi:phytoene dehydrogenase-like protein